MPSTQHPLSIVDVADFYRADASSRLDPKRRSALGQFMTGSSVARFMASLFHDLSGDIHLLDPGAGVGTLTAAVSDRLCNQPVPPSSVTFTSYEIESLLLDYLKHTLSAASTKCTSCAIPASFELLTTDFILHSNVGPHTDLFSHQTAPLRPYTHAILNPPYKKISSSSPHRVVLSQHGLETSNLYTGFLYLTALQLRDGGEMVAIVPRSFCNGPYFKPFRRAFLSMMSIDHIHVFGSRNSAFKDDEVLQENVILHAIRGAAPQRVKITTTQSADFVWDASTNDCVAPDMTQRTVPYSDVVNPTDAHSFINIASNELEQRVSERLTHFTHGLSDLGLTVSTGPVVDFRLKADLRFNPDDSTVPLLYPAHFRSGRVEWPKAIKKPNAICVSKESQRWLWRNHGHFVITKRFTSKEEKRRVVAFHYDGQLPGDFVGFENHLNVFHSKQEGMSKKLAIGLTIFLNSSLVDCSFRQFNGHTQVNAADLRSLRYPSKASLERLGSKAAGKELYQSTIDSLLDEELKSMPDNTNPVVAQRKIDEALQILRSLGMPRGQQNERSALTLLALLDLRPDGVWATLSQPLMGITPIMEFAREHYGREYAPNTRETFRRQTMHQFVEAGIAIYNPDEPTRAVNSPKACYRISEEAYEVIRNFGTAGWGGILGIYLDGQQSLAAKWAKHRDMHMVPVIIAEGKTLSLTPGVHSELIRDIITNFAPRFAPGSEIVYVGDTGDKIGHFDYDRLATMGVKVDQHGKMPDVVLYWGDRDWLLLIESVTSHGPVDSKRHGELAKLFAGARPGLVYVTAFPDRSIMARYLRDISWETEVWCADAPSHLIHFDGERVHGPYS